MFQPLLKNVSQFLSAVNSKFAAVVAVMVVIATLVFVLFKEEAVAAKLAALAIATVLSMFAIWRATAPDGSRPDRGTRNIRKVKFAAKLGKDQSSDRETDNDEDDL